MPLQNATIWTGRVNGLEVLKGDILLDAGLIKKVGVVDDALIDQYTNLARVNANGQWISPG